MTTTITILGCGSSGGVPRIGQGWGACDPDEPRNRRRRCSILIETLTTGDSPTKLLVDASPDLREQLLATDTRYLDAVVLTHDHADHSHGIDDLRPLTIVARRKIDVFANADTARTMMSRFGYCFVTPLGGSYPPILNLHQVPEVGRFEIQGRGGPLAFETFPVVHGDISALALKFKNCLYTPDVSAISDEFLPQLQNLDLWIIDALRPTPHPTHFSLSEALGWIERVRPRRAILTNLHTDLDYRALKASLPPHIEPAYDGMRVGID